MNEKLLKQKNRRTVTDLIGEVIKQFNSEKIAIFSNKQIDLINDKNLNFGGSVEFKAISEAFEKLNSLEEKDFIFADPPIGLKEKAEIEGFKIYQNQLFIYKSLQKLSNEGLGLFLVEPSSFFELNRPFLGLLNKKNFYINAVFLAPPKLLWPHISLSPYLVIISKNKTDRLFLCELTIESDLHRIIDNFINKTDTKNIYSGTFAKEEEFRDFKSFKINQQIESLKTQYKEFTIFPLDEIALEINLYGKGFQDKNNSIYIPKIGNSEPQIRLGDLKIKPHNYIQIVLDESKVINKYLKIFFKSRLGKLILESIKSGTVIKQINKSSLSILNISLPPLATQKNLIESYEKINILQEKINEFGEELSLNPKKVFFTRDKLTPLLDSLGMLTEEEKILEMIRKGEDKHTEFKQTLKKNVATGKKDKNIVNSALKEIVAFLNTEGGTLLIGVSDDKKIVGIEDDFFDSEDKYKLHFQNLVRDRISILALDYIKYKILEVLGKNLFVVYCKPSDKAFFLDGKEFYYRTDPATKKLEGEELLEYIERRFKEKS